jgi:hypothetical protein
LMSSLQRGSPGSTARRLTRNCVPLLTMGP